MVDYSVRVSNLDKNEIKKALLKCIGLFQDQNKERLRKSLAKNLKKKHPIHAKVEMMTTDELFQLCSGLSLHVTRRESGKMQKLIVDHFFEKFPDAPLTNLERVMEEDAYFAQLTNPDKYDSRPTSIVFFFYQYQNFKKYLKS